MPHFVNKPGLVMQGNDCISFYGEIWGGEGWGAGSSAEIPPPPPPQCPESNMDSFLSLSSLAMSCSFSRCFLQEDHLSFQFQAGNPPCVLSLVYLLSEVGIAHQSCNRSLSVLHPSSLEVCMQQEGRVNTINPHQNVSDL